MFQGIDLFSDTVTRPGKAMREAIAQAEVGDEQLGEDPTTLRLEKRVAELLGKESSLFLPTATLANQIALKLHCLPGDEIIGWKACHIFTSEAGGAAVHAGVMTKSIATPTGIFTGQDLRSHFEAAMSPHDSIPRLVCVENTANLSGGYAWPLATLDDVVKTARELELSLHLDGARLWNAAVATGASVSRLAQGFDTVTVCLSKGLGCPTGALLAMPQNLRSRAIRLKHQFGGALRQSGILSAAGLYALEKNVERLGDDHAHAQRLAKGLQNTPYLEVENAEPSTNMIFMKWNHPHLSDVEFARRIEKTGVRFSHLAKNRFRAVTHLDIKTSDIDRAIELTRKLCAEL